MGTDSENSAELDDDSSPCQFLSAVSIRPLQRFCPTLRSCNSSPVEPIAYGFDVANLDRLIAMALPDNLASRRVIEQAGLHYGKQIHLFNLAVLYYPKQR